MTKMPNKNKKPITLQQLEESTPGLFDCTPIGWPANRVEPLPGFVLPGLGGVVARLIWTTPLTLLFTFSYNRTKGSVLIAILLHTSVNYGIDLLGLAPAAAGLFFGMVLVLAGCAVCADRMWHRLPTSVEQV